MSHTVGWRGYDPRSMLILPTETIVNIAATSRITLLVTACGKLFIGCYNGMDKGTLKEVELDCCNISNVAFYRQEIVLVTSHGEVFHFCSDTEKKKRWDVFEPKKTCSHGKEEKGKKVNVCSASAGSDHIVFLSYRCEIWVQGKGPALGLVTNKTENEITNPARVDYFKGRKVISVAVGSYFTIALVEALPPLDNHQDLTDPVSDVDSYVRWCDQCRKETGDKILFDDIEVEKCPLGLGVFKDNAQKLDYLSPTASSTGIDGKSLQNSLGLEEADSNSQSHINSENQSNASCEDFCDSKAEIEMQDLDAKSENKSSSSLFSAGTARFLTRPLLWVTSTSLDSDQLSFVSEKFNYKYPIDSATEIIRENVVNAANLVSSGVKSVGDKVGQLSRHFSSTDSVDVDIEAFIGCQLCSPPINLQYMGSPVKKSESFDVNSLPRPSNGLRNKKCHIRSGSSDFSKMLPTFLISSKSCAEMEKNKESLIQMGKNILNTEIYSWGSSSMGQLGLGDCSHRSVPTNINTLNHFGVKKVVAGCHHTACLTIDGQVYAWGKSFSDPDAVNKSKNCIPKHLKLPDMALTRDIGSGDNFLIVITVDGIIYYIGDDGSGNCIQKRLLISSEAPKCHSVLCCCQSIICSTQTINKNIKNFLKSEAHYLSWLNKISQKIIMPILGSRNGSIVKQPNGSHLSSNVHSKIQETRNKLLECFLSLTYLTTKAVDSLWCNEESDFTQALPIIYIIEEYCSLYQEFFTLFSDTIAVNGFNFDFNIDKFESEFEPMFGSISSKSSTDVISKILSLPFDRVEQYETFMRDVIQDTEVTWSQVILEKLKTSHLQWKKMVTFGYSCKIDAENTAAFWLSCTQKMFESLASPSRRLILHSRDVPLNFHKAGSFFSHLFILLSDVFIHNSYKYLATYNLNTMWVDSVTSLNQNQHIFQITVPEDTLILSCPTASDKAKWMHALQEAIKKSTYIYGDSRHNMPVAPPLIRSAKYVFQKNQQYKDATYSGQWFCGKMDGEGRIAWLDGKRYLGQFRQNVFQGFGRLEEVSADGTTVSEGYWKNGKLDGRGIIKYANGDLYIGFLQKSKPHGHGELKKGRFSSEAASIYTGEWNQGVKQGYGVLDQIAKGEKYHGMWQNNNRHGLGMVVTMNDVYYEGNFTQNKLTGHGLVILEDGTYYEGEVGPSGSCTGKGILRYPCGDYIEGVFSGTWNDGIKINGMLRKAGSVGAVLTGDQPKSFGKTSVPADQKWTLLFKHCEEQLGIDDSSDADTSKVWQSLASFIEKERQCVLRAKGTLDALDGLDKILSTDREMNIEYLNEIRDYLDKAFCSLLHPLGQLLQALVGAFRSTYGGVVSNPRLLHYAVQEVESFTTRLYRIVRYLFPNLPLEKTSFIIEGESSKDDDTVVTAASIIHPYILPPIYASISPLYVKQHQKNDAEYWQRLMKWNRQPDISLMTFLGVDIKMWLLDGENIVTSSQTLSDVKDAHFLESIEALQLMSTSFSPREKLFLIHNCGLKISQEVAKKVGPQFELSMDHLLPIFLYVVVRSRIQHLGAEIGLIKDLMDPDSQNGKLEHMFTTLEACYNYILFENPMSCR